MKKIKLNLGKFTLIDDQDFDLINKKKWFVSSNGYVVGNFRVNKKNKTVLLSRYLLNPPKDLTIDHINRNKLDNQRGKLRIVNYSINNHNQRIRKNNTSGFTGVFKEKRNKKKESWHAEIRLNNGIREYLGTFQNAKEASLAYERKLSEYVGT